MQFYIKKNATLPLLKLQVVKNGRSDFNKFMDLLENSALFFSMIDIETGIPKITSRPAGFVEKIQANPDAEPEYYLYYQFQNKDTNKVGRYEGQFMLRSNDGVLILPIREKLYIDVQESFIADDLPYDSCYVSEFPCCVNGPYTTTTTTVPCPTCPTCPPITTTTTTFNPSQTPTSTPTQTPTPTVTSTPTETPTNTPTQTITPTETPTNTPTPTPTPTPLDEILINPIITENDEYIDVGGGFYLMYVEPLPPQPDQDLINPILTENDEYIILSQTQYLMYN